MVWDVVDRDFLLILKQVTDPSKVYCHDTRETGSV